jgi:hypothetical protein
LNEANVVCFRDADFDSTDQRGLEFFGYLVAASAAIRRFNYNDVSHLVPFFADFSAFSAATAILTAIDQMDA